MILDRLMSGLRSGKRMSPRRIRIKKLHYRIFGECMPVVGIFCHNTSFTGRDQSQKSITQMILHWLLCVVCFRKPIDRHWKARNELVCNILESFCRLRRFILSCRSFTKREVGVQSIAQMIRCRLMCISSPKKKKKKNTLPFAYHAV